MNRRNVFVVCCRASSATAVEVADALGVHIGKTIPEDAKYIVNWGCSQIEGENIEKVLNDPVKVANAVDKVKAIVLMKQAGVNVPMMEDMPRRVGLFDAFAKYPYVARTSTHMDGSGFWKVEDKDDLVKAIEHGADVLMSFEKTTIEYRVHVFNGLAIRCQVKVKTRESANEDCRCTDNGWKLEGIDVLNVPENVRKMAKTAVKALGLDFGAADVGVKRDGTPVVFEVNTAPFLRGKSLHAYEKAINKWIGNN